MSFIPHPFPTRRSSDLVFQEGIDGVVSKNSNASTHVAEIRLGILGLVKYPKCANLWIRFASWIFYQTQDSKSDFRDRKSTRLNSSHVSISYAVFCLKKK